MLTSGYWRVFRPVHINGQDARRGGYQDRAKHETEHSKQADAANDTDEDHQRAQFGAPTEQKRPQDVVHNGGDARANQEQ